MTLIEIPCELGDQIKVNKKLNVYCAIITCFTPVNTILSSKQMEFGTENIIYPTFNVLKIKENEVFQLNFHQPTKLVREIIDENSSPCKKEFKVGQNIFLKNNIAQFLLKKIYYPLYTQKIHCLNFPSVLYYEKAFGSGQIVKIFNDGAVLKNSEMEFFIPDNELKNSEILIDNTQENINKKINEITEIISIQPGENIYLESNPQSPILKVKAIEFYKKTPFLKKITVEGMPISLNAKGFKRKLDPGNLVEKTEEEKNIRLKHNHYLMIMFTKNRQDIFGIYMTPDKKNIRAEIVEKHFYPTVTEKSYKRPAPDVEDNREIVRRRT